MRRQLKAFRKKFGRDPGPDDPVFFDPNSDVPKQINATEFETMILDALLASGAPPEVVYAHKKTGRLGVEGMMDLWDEEDRREWDDAIAEYFAMEDDAKKGPKS